MRPSTCFNQAPSMIQHVRRAPHLPPAVPLVFLVLLQLPEALLLLRPKLQTLRRVHVQRPDLRPAIFTSQLLQRQPLHQPDRLRPGPQLQKRQTDQISVDDEEQDRSRRNRSDFEPDLLTESGFKQQQLADFPWSDLENLTSLQLIRLDNNELENLPQNAFSNLKDLNTLRLNDNRFTTILKGTFDGLFSLSFLQIYNNPFSCSCYLYWLKHWISNAKITIANQQLIKCATPKQLRDELLLNLPDSDCKRPIVDIYIENNNQDDQFYEGNVLILTCEYSGSPKPTVKWRINSKKELALKLTENDSAEMLDNSLKVYNNGTLVISNLKKEDSGVYSCFAANEAGRDEKSVVIEVLAEDRLTTANYAKATQATIQTTSSTLGFNSEEATESQTTALEKANSRCSLSKDTKYVTGFVANASFDDVKQYSFDFGVIALAVTETEAVHLPANGVHGSFTGRHVLPFSLQVPQSDVQDVFESEGTVQSGEATFRAQTESEKALSEGLAEDDVTDNGEKDTEESILADSSSVDKLTNECEVESEYSDRLPLGAEADNITE
ncbi:hypothetical protein WMY93_012631 [Mugilogobius chulae]|uniref:Ig-like domain-containing protein n=1 Tax=Mugilogobius chulae TaxID=88201 RepID=A0AAW0P6R9_9GOBI